MFSSHRNLKRKTPDQGIDRRQYIGHLVDEYYTTTNVEALEQVTANLTNFAYDPINWPHLHEAEAFDVFIASLKTQNQNLQLHGIAAICNICLDKTAGELIREELGIISGLFVRTDHPEIVLHSLALFFQLLNASVVDKELLLTPSVLKGILLGALRLSSYKMFRQFYRHLSSRAPVAKLQQVQVVKRFTQQDLEQFAQFTGDHNYIHTLELPVEERRVHGALLNAVVAGILGTTLPGPGTVVLEQSFKFLKPCRIETDTVVTVRLLQSRKISTAEYDCRQNDEIVFAGNAKLLTRNRTD
ncbi:blast:Armadillo repeat-containing protein 7 [Drosophila guanche]|uniref:Blast:Armadillo repeat-containing protein 7 n=1 Tax=Drosophila guanche TaxID=7266 RepID=A0A3B0KFM9_DROGU|nr:blast:Armadillo repeat-containing protein 7 [Drosophila guanche]